MHKQQSRAESIGGSAVHIDDFHVWAAISYLDSPTDYREYLPYGRPERPVPSHNELTMLEASSHPPWPTLRTIMVTAFLTCMILLLIVWLCD